RVMEDSGLRLLSAVLCVCHTLLLNCPSVLSHSFRVEPLSVVQKQGSAVHLRCTARPATARISWLFQGQPLDPSHQSGVELSPGSLSLSSLQPALTGSYQCLAQSETGSIISRHARVRIADIERFAETHRRTFTVNKGETAFIECPLPRSNPPALPRFRIRGKWLEQSTDDHLILPSGNLQIVSVSSEHQGMYKCGAYNPLTRETQVEAHGTKLIVRDSEGPSPVRIIYPVTPRSLTVDQSGSLTLECVVSGSRSSKVKWIKDGAELSLNSKWMLLQSNLVLNDVQLSDGGHYCCSVLTDHGAVVSVNYTVNVLVQVSILQGLSDQAVTVGSSVRFTCAANGSPTPNITWLLNSAPLTTSPHLQIAGPSLHISSVMVQDQGIYQCLFDNGISSAQSTQSSVHPIQSDEGDELFRSIREGVIGETTGLPTERTSDQPTPEAPIIISPPQTHKPNMYDLEWRAGRDWGIPINAYFVKYRKVDDMGNVVGNWHTVRVPGSEKSLPLSELEPSSLYEVLMVARSAAGEGQPAMLTFRTGKGKNTVCILPIPEAPDRPTISMATESSVYVTWIPRANGGSPITAFRVEYKKQGRSGDWIIAADNISPLKLSVEVRNLEPGSTYRFRVIAMNNYGESPASATSRPYQVSLSSPPVSNRPITGPHISFTDAVSDTQIMLRWTYTPSSNNNTPIQGFYIYYRPTDSDNDSDYKRDVVEGFKFWHLIGQLQPETSYDIKMQCFNDGGESEYSNVMICETKGEKLKYRFFPADTPSQPGGLLYLIVGCVLGVMVLILLVFIVMCLWRNRQQNSLHSKCHFLV
uniref:Cell adhesion molecule-related/down-regulated by oncogenes-like n=1 Tax=Sinocyclocheilus grahami TaxID=75366 RepID=A0A672PCC2_SINGR